MGSLFTYYTFLGSKVHFPLSEVSGGKPWYLLPLFATQVLEYIVPTVFGIKWMWIWFQNLERNACACVVIYFVVYSYRSSWTNLIALIVHTNYIYPCSNENQLSAYFWKKPTKSDIQTIPIASRQWDMRSYVLLIPEYIKMPFLAGNPYAWFKLYAWKIIFKHYLCSDYVTGPITTGGLDSEYDFLLGWSEIITHSCLWHLVSNLL